MVGRENTDSEEEEDLVAKLPDEIKADLAALESKVLDLKDAAESIADLWGYSLDSIIDTDIVRLIKQLETL